MDPVDAVRAMFEAFTEGNLEGVFTVTDDETEFWPHAAGGRVFRGRDEIAAYVSELAGRGERHEATLYGIERHGDVILVSGALRVSGPGHLTESQLIWSYRFEDGRLRRACGHPSRAAALEALALA